MIWDALKATCEAPDPETARLIIESAGIIIGKSDMTVCYDERGAQVLHCSITPAEPRALLHSMCAEGATVGTCALAGCQTLHPLTAPCALRARRVQIRAAEVCAQRADKPAEGQVGRPHGARGRGDADAAMTAMGPPSPCVRRMRAAIGFVAGQRRMRDAESRAVTATLPQRLPQRAARLHPRRPHYGCEKSGFCRCVAPWSGFLTLLTGDYEAERAWCCCCREDR